MQSHTQSVHVNQILCVWLVYSARKRQPVARCSSWRQCGVYDYTSHFAGTIACWNGVRNDSKRASKMNMYCMVCMACVYGEQEEREKLKKQLEDKTEALKKAKERQSELGTLARVRRKKDEDVRTLESEIMKMKRDKVR